MEFKIKYAKNGNVFSKSVFLSELKYPFFDDFLTKDCSCKEKKILFSKVYYQGLIRVYLESMTPPKSNIIDYIYICPCKLKKINYFRL